MEYYQQLSASLQPLSCASSLEEKPSSVLNRATAAQATIFFYSHPKMFKHSLSAPAIAQQKLVYLATGAHKSFCTHVMLKGAGDLFLSLVTVPLKMKKKETKTSPSFA